MDLILNYLKQPSTLRGIFSLLGAFGVAISPELSTEIIATVVGAIGIVEVVRNEDKK